MKVLIKILKPFSFLPAIAMMCAIYYFSAQTGEVSGNLSYEISYQIVETKNEILNTNKSYDQLAVEARSIHYYVRKAAHMTEYFLLAIAVSFPLYVYGVRGFWLILAAGLICVGFAGFDDRADVLRAHGVCLLSFICLLMLLRLLMKDVTREERDTLNKLLRKLLSNLLQEVES